mmetsp:Transcript_30548/g.37640  ORF Transcript_30548/g.37640 Transcript_30548/m.37640 type:complete len:83 (+) Transcript_30548:675-923(+)
MAKQAAARRKLAYDYSAVGSVNKTRRVPGGARQWQNARSLGKSRTKLFASSNGPANSATSRVPSSNMQVKMATNVPRGLSYF